VAAVIGSGGGSPDGSAYRHPGAYTTVIACTVIASTVDANVTHATVINANASSVRCR
jgi:hypothetical protein